MLLSVTFGFIFYKLVYAYKFSNLLQEVNISFNSTLILIVVCNLLLMAINYGLEVIKWHLLIKPFEQVGYIEALKGVFSGIALNLITPNQLGDFLGRVMYLKNIDKVRGTLITVISHTSQVMMTAFFGLSALIWIAPYKQLITDEQQYYFFCILLVIAAIAVWLYLNICWLAKIKLGKVIKPYLDVFKYYTKIQLFKLLLYSLLRYVVFVCQYLLFVALFQVDVTSTQAIACMLAAMFAQSFLPGFILVEIGVRGASALWFFAIFTNQVAPVLLSAYAVWLTNLMVPGLLGLWFIMRWKGSKK